MNGRALKTLLDNNPVLASCLAGRIRVGAQAGEKRPRLDYKSLVQLSEKQIAAAVGFGDSEEVVDILRKMVPDACKPLDLVGFHDLIENSITRRALLDAEIITYPALILLRSQLVGPHLTGGFLSDFGRIFPHSLDILSCPGVRFFGEAARGINLPGSTSRR